ncbi:MAG: N-acetylmuramoyl-L-alanine amidase, partial [Clostridia bacterium]|nr:N-acetylmuramoyl-L-alanine amidase [Clostridia bacterium]
MNDLYIYEPGETPNRHVPLWVLVTIIALVVALLVASTCYMFLAPKTVVEPPKSLTKSSALFPDNFYGLQVDITSKDTSEIDTALLFSAIKKLDNVVIYTRDYTQTDTLKYAIQAAYNQGLSPYVKFDIEKSALGFARGVDLQQAGNNLKDICSVKELAGVLFTGWELYISEKRLESPLAFNYTIEDLCKVARFSDPELFIGLYCSGGPEENSAPIAWIERDFFDMVLIDGGGYMNGPRSSYEENVKAWESAIGEHAETIHIIRSGRLGSGFLGWNEPQQMLWQAVTLKTEIGLQFCLDDQEALASDTTNASPLLYNFLADLADNNYIIKDLVFTSPSAQNSSTYSSVVVFAGASDPAHPLLMNGEEIPRDNLGHFEKVVNLKPGDNKIVFTHKSRDYTFSINYIQAILALVYPNSTEYYHSGSKVSVSAVAKKGSNVKATIGDKTVTLKQESFYEESVDTFGEYYTFVGTITLPVLAADTNLGKVKFEATLNGETHEKEGGTIAVYKKQQKPQKPKPDPDPTFTLPEESGYINVGSSYIAEVIIDRAETFDGKNLNDYSQPTNSYLPKGTVDYCKSTADRLFNSDGEKLYYRTMRYGKRVYESSDRNGKEIKVYEGTLPDTNKLSLSYLMESDRNTAIAFSVDWKAPFRFETYGQKYIDDNRGESRPYYTVDSVTCTYIDITFCYAVNAEGSINFAADNPIFSSAQWIKNEADYTLRLHLRKTGGLYGWSAEYDSEGRLVFTFLHPAKIASADNIYGVSLEGTVILLDPGHTGTAEEGATHNLFGKSSKYNVTEAMANLTLSLEIKRQLESLGATVYLTRTHNNLESTLTLNERIDMIEKIKPDIFISVHHNYNKYNSAQGFSSFYFTPMAWRLCQKIYDATDDTDLYREMRGNMWHTYYITRVTDCPAVLTENGFMSSDYEYQNIIT